MSLSRRNDLARKLLTEQERHLEYNIFVDDYSDFEKLIPKYDRLVSETINEAYKKVSRDVIRSNYEGKEYRLQRIQKNDLSNTYYDKEHNVLIHSIRGTQTTYEKIDDMLFALQARGMAGTPDYNSEKAILDILHKQFPTALFILGGHSRSGNTAVALHLADELEHKKTKVITFNPMSQIEPFQAQPKAKPVDYYNKVSRITNYILNNDFASDIKYTPVPLADILAFAYTGYSSDRTSGLRGITYRANTANTPASSDFSYQLNNHKISNFYESTLETKEDFDGL